MRTARSRRRARSWWSNKGADIRPLVRCGQGGDKGGVQALVRPIGHMGKWVVALALPPRCPGCGPITGELHNFCSDCWRQIEGLGNSGCQFWGQTLEATDIETCAVCLAQPPVIG